MGRDGTAGYRRSGKCRFHFGFQCSRWKRFHSGKRLLYFHLALRPLRRIPAFHLQGRTGCPLFRSASDCRTGHIHNPRWFGRKRTGIWQPGCAARRRRASGTGCHNYSPSPPIPTEPNGRKQAGIIESDGNSLRQGSGSKESQAPRAGERSFAPGCGGRNAGDCGWDGWESRHSTRTAVSATHRSSKRRQSQWRMDGVARCVSSQCLHRLCTGNQCRICCL